MQCGNIIIGHNSGNVGNSGTCMSVQEEETAGHPISPMGNHINYTNVEIHIGLFGGALQLSGQKNRRKPQKCRLMAVFCAGAIAAVLATSTPDACRFEKSECIVISDDIRLNCIDRTKRRKIM